MVLVTGLLPGAYIFLHVQSLKRRERVAWGLGLFAAPALIGLFLSKELSFVLSIATTIVVYKLQNTRVTVRHDLTGGVSERLKAEWPCLPKRERDRIKMEKAAAKLVEAENGRFSVPQVCAVIERAYGDGAKRVEDLVEGEVRHWSHELPREKVGKVSYYTSVKGGKKNE